MWGGNASVNEVLEKFESARCERNGAVGVKRSGVTIALDDGDDKAGLPSGRTTERRRTRLKKESRR